MYHNDVLVVLQAQEVDIDKRKTENGKLSTPSVATLLVSSSPDVKLGSLTLIRHKMTSSHFSKGLFRPVSGGQSKRKTEKTAKRD